MAAPALNLTPMKEDARIKAATDLLAQLNVALMQVTGKINEIELMMQSELSENDRSAKHVEAALQFAQTGVVAAAAKPSTHNEQHLELRAQARALRRTIDARTQDLWHLESALNSEAADAVKPQHAEICARYVNALRELDAIAGEETALLKAAHALGYSPTLSTFVQWPLIGRLYEANSQISTRLREFGNV